MHERQVILSQEDSLSKIAGLISPGSKMLEMGVAAGFFSAFLVNSLNCIVDALEFDQAAAKEVARWSRTLVVTDLSRLELAQLLGDNRYDYIIATEVVVQVGDPIRLVTEIRGLLAKNGSIILAVPNVTHFPVVAALLTEGFPYEHKGPVDNTYLRFFTRNSLMRLLAQCGIWVDRYLPVRKTIRQVDSLGYREGRGAGHALRLANHEEAEVCDHIVVCRPPTTPLVLPEAFQTYVSSPV